MEGELRYHSVILDEETCRGCTICVTSCPAEAIRVQGGKARILAERCIDCGECIRRCPHHAKKALSENLSDILNPQAADGEFRIALPAPSLYGQFPARYGVRDIHRALLALGFDAVFPVTAVTDDIARATRAVIEGGAIQRPLISSSCPTIIKYIQIRFPTLLEHIEPVIAPMELAGRRARERYASGAESGKVPVTVFISPCPGKITEAIAPISGVPSSIDRVVAMKDIHLALIQVLSHPVPDKTPDNADMRAMEIAWGRAGGEAEATVGTSAIRSLAVDGLDQCTKILEHVEDGNLGDVDFLELMACPSGCAGGALTVNNPVLCRHIINLREQEEARRTRETAPEARDRVTETADPDAFMVKPYPARPALRLDADYRKAVRMLEEMERIRDELPGLDCGCCGAPNCRALAEDIVRGRAELADCVIILKEQYRELLDQG